MQCADFYGEISYFPRIHCGLVYHANLRKIYPQAAAAALPLAYARMFARDARRRKNPIDVRHGD
jgi:hypothetical protein